MKFDIKKSPSDVRDYIYRSDSRKLLRESVDLRKWDSIIESQGSIGSCGANALTNAYELMTIQKYPEHFTHLSRLFVYYNTRLEHGLIEEDEGIFLRDGLKSLSKYGVCREELWPYDEEKFDDAPPDYCYEDAKSRKILKYQKLISLYYIAEVLSHNNPVVFGMEIYDSFMDLNERTSTVNFPGRKEKSLGGHAMCMVGYDLKTRLFLAKNSFGSDWGADGYCWIPFDYIRQEGYDIWTFEIANLRGNSNVLSETLSILPQKALV